VRKVTLADVKAGTIIRLQGEWGVVGRRFQRRVEVHFWTSEGGTYRDHTTVELPASSKPGRAK
jgi:hypothetical protein